MIPATIELFRDGRWHHAADVEPLEASDRRNVRTQFGYDVDYAAEYAVVGVPERGHGAVSVRYPVDFTPLLEPTWPAFCVDMLAQGEGRRRMDATNRSRGREPNDWNAVRFGARSPVGNLRVSTGREQESAGQGVGRAKIVERGDEFRAWAESEGIPMTGASDTQGAAPKLLMTQDDAGRFHADGVLPDERARHHWLIKFARGRTRRDAMVLANEAAYLEVARRLGIGCGEPLEYEAGALFVPRFDRVVKHGSPLVRLGLESIYSAMGIVDSGRRLAFEDVVTTVAECASDPASDVCELVKRDALSVALGDTDNHGRNTALLKYPNGTIALSPLFDFAPMVFDPEMVKRTTRWRSEGAEPDWADVCAFVREAVPEAPIAEELVDLGRRLQDAPQVMRDLGVDEEIVGHRQPAIARTARSLLDLGRG